MNCDNHATLSPVRELPPRLPGSWCAAPGRVPADVQPAPVPRPVPDPDPGHRHCGLRPRGGQASHQEQEEQYGGFLTHGIKIDIFIRYIQTGNKSNTPINQLSLHKFNIKNFFTNFSTVFFSLYKTIYTTATAASSPSSCCLSSGFTTSPFIIFTHGWN